MRKIASLLTMLMLMTTFAFAQDRTITGTVIDETGAPVPGASIRIKGTRTGVAADNSGQFSIQAKTGDVLLVTGAGLDEVEARVGTGNTIAILAKRNIVTGSEVIVTGVAGATAREKLTVSVTKISAERINAVPPTSLASALTGKVAGVKTSSFGGLPGQALDIQLRADNNLNNVGSGPLIIVDGVILTGSLADINADDVESMEVVKGAAASALYGSRAGNGVIAVTTKRGKGFGIGTSVTVRNEIGFQNLAKELETAKHHYYTLAPDWESQRGNFTKYAGIVYPAGYSGSGFHPGIVGNRQVDADHYLDNEFGVERNTQKEFFGTGINYTNYLGVGSRSEKSNIYFSFENNSQEGIVKLTDGYKRQNFRLNFDHQLASWLKLSTSNVFINKKVQYPGGGGSLFYDIARFDPDIDLNQVNPVDGQPYYPKINQWNGEQVNPLYRLYKQKRLDKTRRWLSNYAVNIKFTKWANLDVSQSIEIENYRYTRLDPKDTWKTSGGTPATFGMAYTNGGTYQFSSETNSKNSQATLNLSHKFGDLNIKGKLSYLYENREYENFDATGSQFVINDIPSFNNFSSISNATSSITQEKAQNYFAIASFDYKDRYLLDGMFRYDGSSLFGSEARWNPYFRISGAYRISEDVKISGIDELKIRAAYGTAGIRPGFDWQYETYNLSSGVASARQKGNTNLKPSKTAEKEIGLNVNFLKKFTFEGTYAKSETKDQFLNVNLIPFLNDGFSSQYQNAGTVQSNTLELTFGANWLNKGDLSITSNIVFAKIRQKITDLPIPPYTYTDQSQGDQFIFYVKANETYGAMYGRRFVRTLDDMSRQLPTGKTISDYEVNSQGYVVPVGTQGLVTEIPIIYEENGAPWYGKIGDGNADFNMGISNTIRYKGVSLYFLLDWKQGGDIYNGKNQRLVFNLASSILDQSNVPVGQKKTFDYYNKFYDGNDANQYWVEKGTYLKLREVALGYTINSKALLTTFKGAIKEITAKVIGRNLLTFTKYSGYDPEVGSIRQPYDGIYMNPNYRNIAFSLSFNF